MHTTTSSLLLVALFSGLFCGLARAESSPSPSPSTGLSGTMILQNAVGGPVRQGVSNSRPLGDMTFVVKQGDETATSFTTDAQGRFSVSLPPGHYRVVRKDWNSRVGFYGPFEVDVPQGKMKTVEWKCDTGMQ